MRVRAPDFELESEERNATRARTRRIEHAPLSHPPRHGRDGGSPDARAVAGEPGAARREPGRPFLGSRLRAGRGGGVSGRRRSDRAAGPAAGARRCLGPAARLAHHPPELGPGGGRPLSEDARLLGGSLLVGQPAHGLRAPGGPDVAGVAAAPGRAGVAHARPPDLGRRRRCDRVAGRLRFRGDRRRAAARVQGGPGEPRAGDGSRAVALHPSPELLRRRAPVVGDLPGRQPHPAGLVDGGQPADHDLPADPHLGCPDARATAPQDPPRLR